MRGAARVHVLFAELPGLFLGQPVGKVWLGDRNDVAGQPSHKIAHGEIAAPGRQQGLDNLAIGVAGGEVDRRKLFQTGAPVHIRALFNQLPGQISVASLRLPLRFE